MPSPRLVKDLRLLFRLDSEAQDRDPAPVTACVLRPTTPIFLALLLVPVVAPAAEAIVPPRDCGRLTIGTRTFNVKADQMRCADARTYTRRYLGGRRLKPKGFTCRRYSASETSLAFRCSGSRNRTFFAIRR